VSKITRRTLNSC